MRCKLKKVLFVIGLASTLAACSTTPAPAPVAAKDDYTARVVAAQERQDRIAERQIEQAPAWMSKLPKSPDAVYESATAVSSDFSMADMKARTIAYSKICTAAGGKVRSQTKIYRSDGDTTSTESSEMAIRSICPDVDITGVETVEMKHISEGGRIRTYVLVALPIGKANTMRQDKQAQQEATDARKRAPDAFKEVDRLVDPAAPADAESKVNEVKLIDVDNEEYKKRRDETLQKPGAVIGQTTVR
jgi:hypothetical protein